MKIKTFFSNSVNDLEVNIQIWFNENPTITIIDTKYGMALSDHISVYTVLIYYMLPSIQQPFDGKTFNKDTD